MIDNEKIKLMHESLISFVDMLGPDDIYKSLFLEVLFEEIYGRSNNLHIFGKERQEGNQDYNNDEGTIE